MLNIEENVLLSNITTLGIGGSAKKFVTIHSEAELLEAIQYARQNGMDYLVIGGGSNLLVNDHGVDCLVIKNEISGIASQGPTLRVQSGTVLQDLVDYSISHGLSGLHKLTGIPGTVGGAAYGNAGAYGQTISDHIAEVTAIDSSVILASEPESIQTIYGSRIKYGMTKEECGFNYRDSGFKRNKHIILEVTFRLESADPHTLKQEADEVLSKRLVKYPKGIKCPGSFFKNIVAETLPKEILEKIPPDAINYGKLPAGYLLAQVGARGASEDGIYITDYHANLFVNKGNGTAKAFYDLAKKYAEKVKEKFGITLEPEVQLINLPSLL